MPPKAQDGSIGPWRSGRKSPPILAAVRKDARPAACAHDRSPGRRAPPNPTARAVTAMKLARLYRLTLAHRTGQITGLAFVKGASC